MTIKENNDLENRMAVFKGKNIRRIIHRGEWWFSVVDVIEVCK